MTGDVINDSTSFLQPMNCNGTTEKATSESWMKFINVLATVLTTLLGLIIANAQSGNLTLSSTYMGYFMWLFLVYIILRLPTIVASVYGISLAYLAKKKANT